MKKKEVIYHPGKLTDLVERVALYAANHPEEIVMQHGESDYSLLHSVITAAIPDYAEKGTCFNCGHTMEVREYTASLLDGLLLLIMAREVRHRSRSMPFTQANMIHTPSLPTTDGIRHRTTIASYLGLIAQPTTIRGSGHWVITHWGWKMLRGEEIPKSVRYWRGKLIDRSEELTNLATMFQTHVDLVKKAAARRREVEDHRHVFEDYTPGEWAQFGGFAEDVIKKEPESAQPLFDPWQNKI